MSTKARGDQFEDQVFAYIRRYVTDGESFLNPKGCQFFQKKKYYSQKRADDIEIDISVEYMPTEAPTWSMLLAVECKNYGIPVPVGKVEEFAGKLGQIAGHNVKGMFFSSHGFQRGAITYARSMGISLVRLLPSNQIQWVLHRTPPAVSWTRRKEQRREEIETALTTPEYVGQSEHIFGLVGPLLSTSLTELVNELVPHELRVETGARELGLRGARRPQLETVPFIGLEELEIRANRMAIAVAPASVSGNEFDLRAACDYFHDKYAVQFVLDEDLGLNASGSAILGKISFSPRVVRISKTVAVNPHRWRFTLAHELAHLVLHRNLNWSVLFGAHLEIEEHQAPEIIELEPNLLGRLEWQANAFASCLLMDRRRLSALVLDHIQAQGVNNFGHGVIFLDDQACNAVPFRQLVSRLSQEFNVSRQAAAYRLAQLRLLNDQRRKPTLSGGLGLGLGRV